MIVTVLGANSLLGQHLLQHIQRSDRSVQLITWTHSGAFEPRLPEIEASFVERFNGFDALHKAVHRSDLVFNLHEAQDLSLFPRDALLLLHNVDCELLILIVCCLA
ncbi:unnamed protein product [Heligmosomoides polygyrus]|uniref:Epimerase domain-containing protein n=1 Tax=Heligmosomoides polygyrus TaxID=6339 RepID=A0A183GQP1_HELPZ|nr:unnamed protein product [Heligmosomoides polygyrus]